MRIPPEPPLRRFPAFGLEVSCSAVRTWKSAWHRRKQRPPHTAVMEREGDRFVFVFAISAKARVQTREWMPGITILDAETVGALTGPWVCHPDRSGIAKAPRWLVRQVESEPIRDKIELRNEGDVAGLTAEMVRRFPITKPGTRNDTMVRALCSLAGREFREGVIIDVVDRWWTHFHGLGTARTEPDVKIIADSLDAILRSRTLKPAFGVDHTALCRAIEAPEIPPGIAKTKMERAFVEALAVHAIHRIVNLGESPDSFQATLTYIGHNMHTRNGLRPAKATLLELSRKYISTADHTATVSELAYRLERGWKGTASIFALRGLAEVVAACRKKLSGPVVSNVLQGPGDLGTRHGTEQWTDIGDDVEREERPDETQATDNRPLDN